MKLITFQAPRFEWTPFSKTLEGADLEPAPGAVTDAVVVFLHVEAGDDGDRRASVVRQTLKHVKWVANKRALRTVVLHSFTHLGGDTAPADVGESFLNEIGQRLEKTGYSVSQTPFGWFCSWSLDVFGESLAKVFKEI